MLWSLPSIVGYSYCRKESAPPMLRPTGFLGHLSHPLFILNFMIPQWLSKSRHISQISRLEKFIFIFCLSSIKVPEPWAATRSETSYSGLDAVVRTPTRRNGPGAWLWLTAMIGLFVTSNQTELMPQSSFIPIWAGGGWCLHCLVNITYVTPGLCCTTPSLSRTVTWVRHHPLLPYHQHLDISITPLLKHD